jgi:hypothetical protein
MTVKRMYVPVDVYNEIVEVNGTPIVGHIMFMPRESDVEKRLGDLEAMIAERDAQVPTHRVVYGDNAASHDKDVVADISGARKTELKSSMEWISRFPALITDPDGWDRQPGAFRASWMEPITLKEFTSRRIASTQYFCECGFCEICDAIIPNFSKGEPCEQHRSSIHFRHVPEYWEI